MKTIYTIDGERSLPPGWLCDTVLTHKISWPMTDRNLAGEQVMTGKTSTWKRAVNVALVRSGEGYTATVETYNGDTAIALTEVRKVTDIDEKLALGAIEKGAIVSPHEMVVLVDVIDLL